MSLFAFSLIQTFGGAVEMRYLFMPFGILHQTTRFAEPGWRGRCRRAWGQSTKQSAIDLTCWRGNETYHTDTHMANSDVLCGDLLMETPRENNTLLQQVGQ